MIYQPGEHKLLLKLDSRNVEAVITIPDAVKLDKLILIGHPHSLHGGSMNNKVVTTIARACHDLGYISLRFNFRGVGLSEGVFDNGVGESKDYAALGEALIETFPEASLILTGFSFGAYVSYRAAFLLHASHLISIAPAVNHGDFTEFGVPKMKWSVIVANKDEIVPKEDIKCWHQNITPAPTLIEFTDSSHFFHGQLVTLRTTLKGLIADVNTA